jgi:hypothetical protein
MFDLKKLRDWIARRPFVVFKFNEGYFDSLQERWRGTQKFTIALPHHEVRDFMLPTLGLVEFVENRRRICFIGIVSSKSAVTTFETRLTIARLRRVELTALTALIPQLKSANLRTVLTRKLSAVQIGILLSKKLSLEILEYLLSKPELRSVVEAAALNLPKFREITHPEWEQSDAIKTALAAFGMAMDAIPEEVECKDESDSSLRFFEAHVMEDQVILKDAHNVPEFEKVAQDLTGRAVFRKGGEQLTIYTANKGPLEEMLGVDLIYVNETLGNIVMLQYKMLEGVRAMESGRLQWSFRPDQQLQDEIARMKIPPLELETTDYRLHKSPFYFKFVQRKGDGESHKSFVLSLEHLSWLLKAPQTRGPRGGIRLDYPSLGGTYLRESDLIGLIRSGYIGTHRLETDLLRPIISQVARGNRALVVAWQHRIKDGQEQEV